MTSFHLGFLVRRQKKMHFANCANVKLCYQIWVLELYQAMQMEKKHQTKGWMDLEMAKNFFKPKTTSSEVKKQSENVTNIQITSSSKNCEATQPSVTSIASSSKASIDACFQDSFVQTAEIM